MQTLVQPNLIDTYLNTDVQSKSLKFVTCNPR